MEREQIGTRGDEGRLSAVVSRLLHPDLVARVGQQSGQQIKRRLGARCDDDLIWRARHAPRCFEIGRDRRPQIRVTGDMISAK